MKTYKKLSFSEKIKWRIRALWCLLILMIVYMVVIGEMNFGDSRVMTSLAENVSRTIFFGGMIWVIHKIVKNKKLLKSQWQLKEQMKNELDERNQYLHDKSGGIVWDIMFVCLLFVTLTTSLINMPAFYASFTMLCIAVLLKVVVYYLYKGRE